mmetsp:Transcript_15032/g.43410  ORF Transcript_15032/g.43410 Transcript_15032/m.43410 type:complete len:263 (-) Transcript_15032:750-1538(-)
MDTKPPPILRSALTWCTDFTNLPILASAKPIGCCACSVDPANGGKGVRARSARNTGNILSNSASANSSSRHMPIALGPASITSTSALQRVKSSFDGGVDAASSSSADARSAKVLTARSANFDVKRFNGRLNLATFFSKDNEDVHVMGKIRSSMKDTKVLRYADGGLPMPEKWLLRDFNLCIINWSRDFRRLNMFVIPKKYSTGSLLILQPENPPVDARQRSVASASKLLSPASHITVEKKALPPGRSSRCSSSTLRTPSTMA